MSAQTAQGQLMDAFQELCPGRVGVSQWEGGRPRFEDGIWRWEVPVVLAAWKTIMDALTSEEQARANAIWGATATASCSKLSCGEEWDLRPALWPISAPNLDREPTVEDYCRTPLCMPCVACGSMAPVHVRRLGAAQIVLWPATSSPASLTSWLHHRAPGGQHGVLKLFWEEQCTVGALVAARDTKGWARRRTHASWLRGLGLSLQKHLLAQAIHRCTDVLCDGPRGHRCKHKGGHRLPACLSELLSLCAVDTDLLANWTSRHMDPGITSWMSPWVADRELGSAGDARTVSLEGRRMLIHYEAGDMWRAVVAPRLRAAIGQSPTDTAALVFGDRKYFTQVIIPNEWIVSLALTTEDQRGQPDPHQVRRAQTANVGDEVATWALWWIAAPTGPVPSSWCEVTRVLRKLQKVHICAALDARRKEELVRKRELSECKSAEERMRAMDAMHQTKQSMDAARTASGRKKYARQLQAYIIREHTRRIAMGGNDVTDLEVLIRAAFTDQQADHRRDRTTWGVPPPTEGVCEDAVQQWRDFLVQQRRHKALMLGTDLPTTRQVHAMRGAAWILRWDWAATTRIVRSTEVPQRASYQARQRRVFLHTREPIPWRTPPAAIYIDVLAGDEVLQVLTVCEPQILAVVRCTWGSLLGNGTIFTPSTADRAGHIWARPMTMEGVLADQIRIQERMREDGQEQIRPSPEAPVDAQKQLQDCIDMWHVSEDDELPGCSEPMLRTTVMRKKLVVDLSKPEYEAEFAESVQEAIVDGVHPILALQRAAELLMEEQAERPGGADEAKGAGRERGHRRPSSDLESQLGRIAQARAACDACDPSVADMNGARMTDSALAAACAEGKEDAFENMANALDRKEADLRMQAQFRQATASARKTEAEHENAKRLWKHNRPAAFAEMTRRPDKEAR